MIKSPTIILIQEKGHATNSTTQTRTDHTWVLDLKNHDLGILICMFCGKNQLDLRGLMDHFSYTHGAVV